MFIRSLQFVGFRNLVDATFEPSTGFNVFWGDNGQGKTNLLEAIYLASTLRSFRTSSLSELIKAGTSSARVTATLQRQGLERVYEVRLSPGKRDVLLDGKTPRHLSDYFGGFNVVLFAPEDLSVPRGSPADRRRFLDRSVFNRDATFLLDAQRYARILKSRNTLLRQGLARPELLDVYDDQLAATGLRVATARRRYLDELRPLFVAAFTSITNGELAADLGYRTRWTDLRHDLAAARQADLGRGKTTVGPHVDDLELRIEGKPVRVFASQGQLRALVLAWKTAELTLLAQVLGESPVLLLDDVSSELDANRNRSLFDFLAGFACQCFVTTTHPAHVLSTKNRTDFQVISGTFGRQNDPGNGFTDPEACAR